MGENNDDAKVMRELVEFLAPETRLDLRRQALQIVIGLSGSLDGSAGKMFANNEYAIGKALCVLCEATISDRSQTLSALTNFTSGSADAAAYIMENSKVLLIAYDSCGQPYANFGARLLANLSRHFPSRVLDALEKHDEKFMNVFFDKLSTPSEDSLPSLLGFTLVNLSTLPKIRHQLVKEKLVDRVFPLLEQSQQVDVREVAADLLRNLAFEDGLHKALLDDSDAYLTALLTPLADSGDDLDDDDIQKLPLRIQYFEGTRETSSHVRQKLVEALYQLCSTRHGRETLRSKGVYALMRELDKATTTPEDPNAPPPKMRNPVLLAQEEHTLHALIGMLIRYEEEMAIDPNVESLRELQ